MIKKNVNFQAHDIYVSRIFEPGAVGKEGTSNDKYIAIQLFKEKDNSNFCFINGIGNIENNQMISAIEMILITSDVKVR